MSYQMYVQHSSTKYVVLILNSAWHVPYLEMISYLEFDHVKYLWIFLAGDNSSYEMEMSKLTGSLYARCNTILRKFNNRSVEVKKKFFLLPVFEWIFIVCHSGVPLDRKGVRVAEWVKPLGSMADLIGAGSIPALARGAFHQELFRASYS